MRLLWGLVLVFIVFSCKHSDEKKKRVLPFIGNFDIEYKLVDGAEVADTVYPTVPFFYFRDQDSALVRSSDMKGKVWVADFFFTTCQTICPIMTTNMKRLNVSMKDLQDQIQFISFTINPDHDGPAMLRKYIHHHGILAKNWKFLTGNEEETHRLGIENFQIFAGRDDEADGGFAHSGAFTIVDREGYVRGVYLGTDSKQVDQLEKDLRKLLEYEYGIK
jgi:protein SCO1/2